MFFRCKNCEGNVIYSPLLGKMYCPHCEGIDSEVEEKKGITECANCGAPLTPGEYDSTCRCEYCGSYIILDDRVSGEFRPDRILPFRIDRTAVAEKLREEFKRRIFTPDSFLSDAALETMKGMYVPFWMFDYSARYNYEGRGTKVRVWTAGDTEYTETSFFRVKRDLSMDFDQVPADASIAMPDEIMDMMEPYDYGELEDFILKYMSGFYAERYNEGADALEPRARGRVEQDAELLLKDTLVEYTTLIPEKKELETEKKKVSYSLLPVWKYSYRYKEKNYDFYINGETGKIVGETPVSKKKVLVYGGTVFALVSAALYLLTGILGVL